MWKINMSSMFDKEVNRRGTGSMKWNVGEHELPMWVADMDFETAPAVTKAIMDRAVQGIYGYTEVSEEWYLAYQNWWQDRHHFPIEKDWLIFCTGVVPAISSIVRKMTTVAEKIVVMTPCYNIFFNSIVNNGRNVLESRLHYEDGVYSIDQEDLEEKLADPQTSMLILCNPHNPVGRVWTKEELLRLGDICERYGVIVVSDEIHADFVFEGSHQVLAGLKESYRKFVVTCTAPSKTFNIASMMISNIFIPNRELKAKFRAQLDAAGISQLNVLGLVACEAAYVHGEEWYEAMHSYVADNIAFTKEYVETQLPGVSMVDHEGTYLVWLDFRKTGLSVDELENLIVHRAKLWLDSGKIFGDCGKGFQRINVACPRATLQEALDRIKTAMKESKAQ